MWLHIWSLHQDTNPVCEKLKFLNNAKNAFTKIKNNNEIKQRELIKNWVICLAFCTYSDCPISVCSLDKASLIVTDLWSGKQCYRCMDGQ